MPSCIAFLAMGSVLREVGLLLKLHHFGLQLDLQLSLGLATGQRLFLS